MYEIDVDSYCADSRNPEILIYGSGAKPYNYVLSGDPSFVR
jgi:hypothetical protein